MGTETLITRETGQKITAEVINLLNRVLEGDFVGRDSTGAPALGQLLGTLAIPWNIANITNLILNGSPVDPSLLTRPPNIVSSGLSRSNSDYPAFLDFDNITNAIEILGDAVNLNLLINGSAAIVGTDINTTGLTVAPSSNNTCLVNEPTFVDQESTKYAGEDGTTLNIDAAGSEITSRIGQVIALQKNGSTEIMLAYVKSTTELTNIFRGWFYDSNGAPIVRETLADDDQLNILSLAWIFVEDDGLIVEISYKSPIYSFDQPSGTAGDYWFDLLNNTWKVHSGVSWDVSDQTLVGACAIGTTKTGGQRPLDFYHDYRDTNTIQLEIFSSTVIQSKSIDNLFYAYSKSVSISETKITWNSASDMETGSITANTIYYLYIAKTGQRVISLEKPYDRIDLNGKYHPYEAWRYVGEAETNSNSQWSQVYSHILIDDNIGKVGKNSARNSAMVIDTRDTVTTPITASSSGVYTIDGFIAAVNGGGAFSVEQESGQVLGDDFEYCLLATSTVQNVSRDASDYSYIKQKILGYNVSDLAFGTNNAKKITISFKVKSSLGGVYSLGLQNAANDRAMVKEVVLLANVTKDISLTLTGDLIGTWLNSNDIGLELVWDLGSGSNYEQPPDVWAAGNKWLSDEQVDWMGQAVGATFRMTAIHVEVGNIGTEYPHEKFKDTLAECRKFLPAWGSGRLPAVGNAISSVAGYLTISYPETRVPPNEIVVGVFANILLGVDGVVPPVAISALGRSNFSTTSCRLQPTAASSPPFIPGQVMTLDSTTLIYLTGAEL